MIKAIIFDFGSVIYKTDWKKLNKHFFNKFGFEILIENNKDDELIRIYRMSDVGREEFKSFFTRINPDIKNIEEVIDNYKKMYFKSKILNTDLMNLINKLKKKYIILGFTDTKKEHYESNLEKGIYKDFKKVFTSFKFGLLKADKGAFELLTKELKKLKLKPRECIFIDDYLPNIENARQEGFKTIHHDSFPKIDNLKEKIDNILKDVR